MLLKNLTITGENLLQNIHIENGNIAAVTIADTQPATNAIVFDAAVALPGLINAHDHLDFNLFPQLGNGVYNNYTEWAADIHTKNKKAIAAVLKVPQALRVQWGLYKNLLAGVTTVVNHGEKLAIEDEFITVLQDSVSLHSMAFEKGIEDKLNSAFKNGETVVMHVGEGTDETASDEIDRVIGLSAGRKNIVAVHGVAMSEAQAQHFKALVWCPDSNYFLLGKTAAINKLKKATTILFGSDSTLSSGWNIWDHIRLAKQEQQLNDEALLNSLTTNAANTWQLNTGSIAPEMQADIVIAKKSGHYLADTDPEDISMVIQKGGVKLFDKTLLQQVVNAGIILNNFSRININGQCKYVYGDLPGLMNKIKRYYPAVKFPIQPCK